MNKADRDRLRELEANGTDWFQVMANVNLLSLLDVADRAERAEATVKSLSVMLGWVSVPPQRSLEMTISAMRARGEAAEKRAEAAEATLGALRMCDACGVRYDRANGGGCLCCTNRRHEAVRRAEAAEKRAADLEAVLRNLVGRW